MRKPIYLLVYSIPIVVGLSFQHTGWMALRPMLTYFGLIPLVELLLKPNHSNKLITPERAKSKFFDLVLYLAVPIQVGLLIYFLYLISSRSFSTIEYVGHTFSMGLMCGVFGINIAHELGHRKNRFEQLLAEILLLTSLEMHFLPYHNLVHHKQVATPADPATARINEPLFFFWFRSQFGSYFQAWRIEKQRINKRDETYTIFKNRVFIYSLLQMVLLISIYLVFGIITLVLFFTAAIIGILMLETVNYIEHYGLRRRKTKSDGYERVQVWHSWNSDHPLGRAVLFELSRHSDHHYKASKPYHMLLSYPESPQMPTGYPGMMLLSLLPPIWFWLMNRRVQNHTLATLNDIPSE